MDRCLRIRILLRTAGRQLHVAAGSRRQSHSDSSVLVRSAVALQRPAFRTRARADELRGAGPDRSSGCVPWRATSPRMSDNDGGQQIHVTVLTHSASPYQVELFDEIASSTGMRLHVVY